MWQPPRYIWRPHSLDPNAKWWRRKRNSVWVFQNYMKEEHAEDNKKNQLEMAAFSADKELKFKSDMYSSDERAYYKEMIHR